MSDSTLSGTIPEDPPADSLATWRHCRPFRIEGSGNLAGHQVRLTLQGAQQAAPDHFRFDQAECAGADLRFVDADGKTLLPFWIEQWDDAARTAVIWVKVPAIPRTLFMYWGKPGAGTRSNGDETFEFFDDFETPFLETHPTNIPFGGEPAAFCEEDGDHIDLWYSGPGNTIHYASSTDGITFDCRPTDIPAGHLRSTVLKKDGLYYLYCARDDRTINLFTSRDKIHFQPGGVVLAGGAGSENYLANMFVWVENDTWYMLYEAMRDGQEGKWVTCLATSPTPTGFASGRYPGNPVMTAPGPGCGNPELARIGSRILRRQGRYYQFYHRAETWRAWSTDLHSWTQEGLVWGFDKTDPTGFSCGDASLCQFRNRTYLWKSLSDQVARCSMAVAIADLPLEELLAREVPLSAAKWEDPFPDGGYHKYPDIDTTLARTGASSIFLKKQYWRQPRDVAVSRRFRPAVPVVFTAWFHDDATDTCAQAHVAVRDADHANLLSMGVDTALSKTHYAVLADGRSAASVVPRTTGWHKFEFIVQDAGTEVRIDGIQVGRAATIKTATMGSVALWNNREMPLNASVDSIAIRRYAVPEPVVVFPEV